MIIKTIVRKLKDSFKQMKDSLKKRVKKRYISELSPQDHAKQMKDAHNLHWNTHNVLRVGKISKELELR